MELVLIKLTHIIIKNQTELGVVGEELETEVVVENTSSHSSSDSHSRDSEDSDDSLQSQSQ